MCVCVYRAPVWARGRCISRSGEMKSLARRGPPRTGAVCGVRCARAVCTRTRPAGGRPGAPVSHGQPWAEKISHVFFISFRGPLQSPKAPGTARPAEPGVRLRSYPKSYHNRRATTHPLSADPAALRRAPLAARLTCDAADEVDGARYHSGTPRTAAGRNRLRGARAHTTPGIVSGSMREMRRAHARARSRTDCHARAARRRSAPREADKTGGLMRPPRASCARDDD